MTTETSMRLSVIAGAGVLLCLSGCSAAGEHAARSRWDETFVMHYERAPVGTVSSDTTHAPAGLEELIALAERRNPGLRAAFDRWTSSLEQVPQARALPDPRISYAYFIESVETRVGPQRQRFGVSQTIPLFGKLGLRGEVAVRAANAEGARFETARRQLRFRLTELWNDYYYLRRAIAVTEDNVQLVANLESVALAQYTSGRAPHAAVIRAQVELGRLEDRLRTLRDQRTPLIAALNAELDVPPSTPIAWPDTIDVRPVLLTGPELRDTLLRQNPELAAHSSILEKQEATARLAGRSPIPDLTIGAEYIETDDARFPGVRDSGKDAAVAMATLNIPLWFGRYGAEKAQARARVSAAAHERDQVRNRLLADLERILFELRDAERRIDLYAYTLLPRAQQSLEVTKDAFATGRNGFLDLIDAQRTLLDFELAYERAIVDRATRRARLEQIVGTGLDTGAANGGVEP